MAIYNAICMHVLLSAINVWQTEEKQSEFDSNFYKKFNTINMVIGKYFRLQLDNAIMYNNSVPVNAKFLMSKIVVKLP